MNLLDSAAGSTAYSYPSSEVGVSNSTELLELGPRGMPLALPSPHVCAA